MQEYRGLERLLRLRRGELLHDEAYGRADEKKYW